MPRGRMGGRHGMSTEKAKDFKGTMKTVSYTHLDVYKRQSQSWWKRRRSD